MDTEKLEIQLNNLRERLNEFTDIIGEVLGVDEIIAPEETEDSS